MKFCCPFDGMEITMSEKSKKIFVRAVAIFLALLMVGGGISVIATVLLH